MQPHQQRVCDEKVELDEKVSKLMAFQNSPFFATLPDDEQERLNRQCRIMNEYSDVLGERISVFE